MFKLATLPLALLIVATLLQTGCAEGDSNTNAAEGETIDTDLPAIAQPDATAPTGEPSSVITPDVRQALVSDGDPYPGLHPGLAPLADRFGRQRVAVILISDPPPTGATLLMQQVRRIQPTAEVIQLLPNAPANEIQIAIAPVNDLRALGNRIPFGRVDRVDEQARSVSVEYQQ